MLLLEGRPLVRRDHRLEGEHVDGRDGHDLAGVGAEAVQLDRAIGRDEPAAPATAATELSAVPSTSTAAWTASDR